MSNKTFQSLFVGVSSMEQALKFWQDAAGFGVLFNQVGNDADVQKLLGLGERTIKSQAILGTYATQNSALLHLIEFSEPTEAVRKGAGPTDSCPKNIDIYSNDLERHYPIMKSAGYPFRAPWQLLHAHEPDGHIQVKEGHISGPDDTNIGIMELEGIELPFNATGFGGLGPVVTTVNDMAAEHAFYAQVFGLDVCLQEELGGPEIEKLIGLPPGKAIDIHILGDANDRFGRIELIEYQGVSGENLYPRAQAPATGALHISYQTTNIDVTLQAAEELGVEIKNLGRVTTLDSNTPRHTHQLTSPAGLKLFVFSEEQ